MESMLPPGVTSTQTCISIQEQTLEFVDRAGNVAHWWCSYLHAQDAQLNPQPDSIIRTKTKAGEMAQSVREFAALPGDSVQFPART